MFVREPPAPCLPAPSHCIYVLRGHTATVRCARILHNRPIAVTGSRDSTLRVWNIQKGVMLRVLSGHTASVRCLDVCGNKVVSGSYDTTCRVSVIPRVGCLVLTSFTVCRSGTSIPVNACKCSEVIEIRSTPSQLIGISSPQGGWILPLGYGTQPQGNQYDSFIKLLPIHFIRLLQELRCPTGRSHGPRLPVTTVFRRRPACDGRLGRARDYLLPSVFLRPTAHRRARLFGNLASVRCQPPYHWRKRRACSCI